MDQLPVLGAAAAGLIFMVVLIILSLEDALRH